MTDGKPLSEKKDTFLDMNRDGFIYYQKDVREAVQRLKDVFSKPAVYPKLIIIKVIDKIFGEELSK